MPEIIIIAGPNGAGKTSFAGEYLTTERAGFAFINADEIARTMAGTTLSQAQIDTQAARAMLDQVAAYIDAGSDFVIETTLASLTYATKFPAWRQAGYRVILFYLRLPNVEASIDRVKRRVVAGGHDIPEDVIRRRFAKSLNYLETRYKAIVDEWYVWDSLEGSFTLAEAWAING